MASWNCRLATLADEGAINALQVECTHQLGLSFFTGFELAAFVREVGTQDTDLIHRGTYYVVEYNGYLIGCGGWSDKPSHADMRKIPESIRDLKPKIRAIFVDQEFIRRGIGTMLLRVIERDIRQAGYSAAELTTLLSACKFYDSFGYKRLGSSAVELYSGACLPAVRMEKDLAESPDV